MNWLFWKRKVIKQDLPDYSVHLDKPYRAVTRYDQFYIQRWYPDSTNHLDGGTWGYVAVYESGHISPYHHTVSFWRPSSVEEACDICNRLNAGETYFEKYDKIKFKVLNCECDDKAN